MPKPRRSGGRLVISALWNSIVPASGFSSPAIMRKVVVFPQPDGPSSPKNSPCATSSDTSATARVVPKLREIFFSERKAILRIANCQFPIADLKDTAVQIGNRKSEIGNKTYLFTSANLSV